MDAHVGAHLFQQCITGLLAHKTRVFVTNQLQYVPAVDLIVMLKDGHIAARGTYDQLMAAGTEFGALMKNSGADSNSVAQGDLEAVVKKGRQDYKEKRRADKVRGNVMACLIAAGLTLPGCGLLLVLRTVQARPVVQSE